MRAGFSTGICRLAYIAFGSTNGPTKVVLWGEKVLRGPRLLASFNCWIAVSVVLIDLYHLHWHKREQTTPPTFVGALICQATRQKLCLIQFFSPGPGRGLIFTNSFFTFGRGGKPGQGVPLNGSNLEKWIEPSSLMANVAAANSEESGSANDTWRRSS